MLIILTLDKSDIKTEPMGNHYQIKTPSGLVINFTPDAVDEFINDIQAIREIQKKQQDA